MEAGTILFLHIYYTNVPRKQTRYFSYCTDKKNKTKKTLVSCLKYTLD